MNLRKVTILLILGSAYTVLHKLAFALFPLLAFSPIGRVLTTFFWQLATFALIVFAYQFLRELSPRDRWLRYSLIFMMVFTGIIIISKVPFWWMSNPGLVQRLIFRYAAQFNGFAVLSFLLSFRRFVRRGSSLWVPLRGLIVACCLTMPLGFASSTYQLSSLLTGLETPQPPFLQPLAVVSFLFTYGMIFWFLISFLRLEDYQDLTGM